MNQVILIGWAFVGISTPFILYEVSLRYKVRNWLSVEGEIKNSDNYQIGEAFDLWNQTETLLEEEIRKVSIKAAIRYQYKVNNQIYHSDQVILDKLFDMTQEEIDERSEKYLIGKTINVYYNPKNPSESYLQNTLRMTDKYISHFSFMFFENT